MAKNTIFDVLFSTKENEKLYYEAGILVEVCEKLHELMAQKGFRNVDIAKKLGVSTSQVSQWLDGSANMQLKTVANILFAMGMKFNTFEAESIVNEMAITAQTLKDASKSKWPDSPESSRATHAAPISSSESNSNERMAAA